MAIEVQYRFLWKASNFIFELKKKLPVVYLVGSSLCEVENGFMQAVPDGTVDRH